MVRQRVMCNWARSGAHHAAAWQELHDTLVALLPRASFVQKAGAPEVHTIVGGDRVLQQVFTSHLGLRALDA